MGYVELLARKSIADLVCDGSLFRVFARLRIICCSIRYSSPIWTFSLLEARCLVMTKVKVLHTKAKSFADQKCCPRSMTPLHQNLCTCFISALSLRFFHDLLALQAFHLWLISFFAKLLNPYHEARWYNFFLSNDSRIETVHKFSFIIES